MKKILRTLCVGSGILLCACAYFQPRTTNHNAADTQIAKPYDTIAVMPVTTYPAKDYPKIQQALSYQDWLTLSKDSETGEYQVQKAEIKPIYSYVKSADKKQMPTTYLQVQSPSVLLIRGLDIPFGPLNSAAIDQRIIWPGQQLTFSFNGQKYYLTAQGNIEPRAGEPLRKQLDDVYYWEKVSNYKLFLSDRKKEPGQLLFSANQFNETIASLIWVGDIDKDGKPDFLFANGTERTEPQITLFLSTLANEGDFVKQAASFTFTASEPTEE